MSTQLKQSNGVMERFSNLQSTQLQYLCMKNTNKLAIVLFCLGLIFQVLAEDEVDKIQDVFIGKHRDFKLEGTTPFVGHYSVKISQTDAPKDQQKWYLFVMAEPKEKSKQLLGSPTKIQIKRDGVILKECTIIEESDSCFIKNDQFDFKKDNLKVSVHCDDQCEFQLVTQIDYAYPLKMNKAFKLNFEDSAYSKVFTLDTTGEQFHELRILLEPKGFINYGEPVILLANYGKQIPTQAKHDFKGIHIWDDGQGIFIRKSELKERQLTILVEGPQKNILSLIAQGWQKEQKLQLQQYWPQFDWLKAGENRQSVFELKDTSLTHRIKVVVFSGYLEQPELFQVEEGISEKLKPIQLSTPNRKYGEFQIRLSKQLIKDLKLKKVALKLLARKQTTYVINYAREQSALTTIHPYVSQSSIMEPNQTDQYYVKVQQLIESTKEKKTSKIEIIVSNINGDLNVTFYKCKAPYTIGGGDNMKNCQIKKDNKQDFTQANPVRYENRGAERRYWFEILWEDLVKKSDKDKTQVVYQLIVVIDNIKAGQQSTYEIQYKNKDRIYLLKEGELTKDRVFINQKRHYKLSVADSDATEVRFHCTRISGQAFFIGSIVDPRVNKDHEKVLPLYSVISIKLNPDQKINQVFLEVEGVDNAYYSITTQVLRKSEANPSKKNGTGYNQLIVREDIPYEFLIAPLDSIVLQVHSQSKRINLNLKSTSAVKLCMTENLASPPFAPNCEISNDFFLDMNEEVIMDRGLVGNIGIKNTNTDKNVSVKIFFSSEKKKEPKKDDDDKSPVPQSCEIGAMNEVMFERLGQNGKDKQGQTTHCIQFQLNKNEEIELIVDVRGEHFYDQGSITASINGQETIKILSPSHIFTKEEVESSCAVNEKSQTITFCYLKVKAEGLENVRVRVLAQYTNDAIRLVDGIAHPVHAEMSKSKPRHFYTGIHNTEDLIVYLENKVGEYKVYASLMPLSEFKKADDSFPTKDKKDLESSNPFYYLQHLLVVPKEKIAEKCPHSATKFLIGRKWLDCVLLLTVVLDGSTQYLKSGKFVIEATQQNRQLRQNVPLTGFLQKKSVAYYNYHNENDDSTILVTINNQNKNCAEIYLRKGSERATSQYNDKHAKTSNTLIYSEAKSGTYSIAVQATENCPYTIIASAGKNKIRKIKKGTFADINLAMNEQTNLLFENHMNETFKVLSLHKSGQVIISVNPVPREQLQGILSKDINQITDWEWSNKDSVRISNLNKKNEPSKHFCVDCYYLINVNAQRPTEASIVIPTPGSQLPITTDSLIKDLVKKQEIVTYRVFTDTNSQFEVYVQYGKIQITIVQSDKADKNIISYNKTFEATKAPSLESFTLSKAQTFEFLRYIKISIRAIQDTYFSFSIVSSPDPTKRGPGLKYGLPEYIYLDSNKQKCLNGSMTASIDEFLCSFSKADKKLIEQLEVKVKINDKQTPFERETGNNEMLLKVSSLSAADSNQNKKFEICLKSKTPVSITLIQSSPLIYWPQKQSIIVKKASNLTFGAEGKSIIEINECKSRATTEIFSEFHNMKSTSSEIKQRRKSNNIIEFYHYGPVYIKIASEKATLRWISVNETSGAGQGYDDFKSSWIRVVKSGDSIEITADPIKPTVEDGTKSQIVSATYSFFAAKEEMELYNAMNCGQGDFSRTDVKAESSTKSKQPVKALFNIKSQLKPKFGNIPYFLVGVKTVVTIKTKEGEIQTYRFFYPYQQVSRETILYGTIKPIVPETEEQQDDSNDGTIYFVGYALVALIIITAGYCVYVKYLKKCLAKKVRNDESMGRQMKYFDLTENH